MLCAGAPDTPEIGAEVEQRVERLRAERGNVIWIDQMLPKPEVIQLLSHATVFACPSIYEPLGIVNLEAMACEAAVVATATGGIVEVVVDGETGLLVPFEQAEGDIEPRDPEAFVAGIAERVNALVADPDRARGDGPRGARAGGDRVRLGRDRPPDLGGLRGPRSLRTRCITGAGRRSCSVHEPRRPSESWYVRCPCPIRARSSAPRQPAISQRGTHS